MQLDMPYGYWSMAGKTWDVDAADFRIIHELLGHDMQQTGKDAVMESVKYSNGKTGQRPSQTKVKVTVAPKDERYSHLQFRYITTIRKDNNGGKRCVVKKQTSTYYNVVCEV